VDGHETLSAPASCPACVLQSRRNRR
jgi:hypothetical protein